MFINLSKKINFPAGTQLHCISWSKTLGSFAIGGDDDFLRVIHLNTDSVPVTVETNVSLPGHSGDVIGVIWNDVHKKLTTYDRNGLIIVWIQTEDGTWYEEMINDRKISVLKDIAWDSEGKKICIVYEDGYVIVGDVNGERVWGKELWVARIILVEWSPDSKLILLGLINGEVHIYDRSGSFLYQLEIPHLRCTYGSNVFAGIQWYNGSGGYSDPDAPALAVCLKYGRCQIMSNRYDQDPIFIDTKMIVAQIAWNHNGSVLTFAGSEKREEETGRFNIIKFYDPYGNHLRTLDIPGEKLTSCSWGPKSEYLALVRDSCCYLASNKPDHKWGYCSSGDTLVYTFQLLLSREHCVVFFKVGNGMKYVNYVKKLINFATCSDYCCLASKVDNKYVLALCDPVGTPIDSKFIELKPMFLTVTKTHVIAASRKAFYTWQFKSIPFFSDGASGQHKCFERLNYMANSPSEAWSDDPSTAVSRRSFDDTGDICSICASDKFLIVGCVSGILNLYSMPAIFLLKKHSLKFSPRQLSLNCLSTRLSIIDFYGKLKIFVINDAVVESGNTVNMGNLLDFVKSDVRHMRWAEDLHSRFVLMDKTRMCVYVDTNEVENRSSKGYICEFSGARIRLALMNDVMEDPENPETYYINYETAYHLV